MPIQKLKQFLDQEKVRYVSIVHSPAFTAQEIAAAAHVPGGELAKTIVVHLDGKIALAVLPANRKIILEDLREAAGVEHARFATEDEFKTLFPDCEVGAMPPFGSLYGMDVYAAPALTEDNEIAFNAGTHTELIKMEYEDFARLAKPKVASFTT
ncbi:MAG: YbaK/prolyl-tRNA synthetase associated region [Pedosphaera sp.]|nr:YbaK/prolyl-tRNA synthetase associated region [Pedosphaera sp.]